MEEAVALVREHGHFRDKEGFVDNYYICDGSFAMRMSGIFMSLASRVCGLHLLCGPKKIA